MNNDYFVGELTRQRHDDYLREVEHAELIAEARRASALDHSETSGKPTAARPADRRGWRHALRGSLANSLPALGRRP